MNIKTIYTSAIVFLALLFAACDIAGSGNRWIPGSDGKAAVRIHIGAASIQGRTVMPASALQDVSAWELRGAQGEGEETLLTEFSSTEGATVDLEPGTWNFTLKGYQDDGDLILSGSIADKTISLGGENTLEFFVAPVLDGEGNVSITIELPPNSGITEARIFKDGTNLETPITPNDNNQIVLAYPSYPAGDYYFSIRLYKGDELYGVVSEAVQVRANLDSVKSYTLTMEDLNRVYIVTFDAQGGSVDQSTITVNAGGYITPLPTATKRAYAFNGWFTQTNGYGYQFTASTPVNEDTTVYASWTASGATLTEGEGVYIGIISFAATAEDLTNGRPIFLDYWGKENLINMINSSYTISNQDGTALFYGVHKALANLDSITTYPDNLDYVNVITFTDGLDTSSSGESKDNPIENQKFDSGPKYAEEVNKQIDERIIGGMPITAYSVGVKGADVTNTTLFESNLEMIASDEKDSKLEDTEWEKVKDIFKDIAGKLETQYSITNFNMNTAKYDSGTWVRLTFETDEAPNAEVDSSRFIQGIITDMTDPETGENVYNLSEITYGEGLSSKTNESLGSTEGVGPIRGSRNSSGGLTFSFTNMTGFDPDFDGEPDPVTEKPLHAKQWRSTDTTTGTISWQVNSEYKIKGAADPYVVKRSALIYLVLDASASLEETQIEKVREAANEFINVLYARLHENE
jgi:hypothetical protein